MTSRFELANAIRALSMDAVQKAKSGHPGAPMGMADIAEVLWNDFLCHNPKNPKWVNRDRFVLSNGHGSMLIYSLLHLSGYALTIEDLKNFRQLHSKTPGHPEYGYTAGVETTTGPLGQGIANAVGFAISEKSLAAQFNRVGHQIIDHYTYAFLGDGCLMEGISHEACSLAGTLGLGKLIAFYDDNGISIDGEVKGWFTDNTPKRFESYGWQVIANVDGHNPQQIKEAIEKARDNSTQPTLICCKTIIGFGAPNKEGTESCHGAPLGDAEIVAARAKLGWSAPAFEIPEKIAQKWDARDKGQELEDNWTRKYLAYHEAYPELASELNRRLNGDLPKDFNQNMAKLIAELNTKETSVASRKASQMVLESLTGWLPEMMGGSADLAGSNLTITSHSKSLTSEDASGNYVHYGVREFAMSAIMNGMALHGGFVPYGATFLMFMEYARNALRMAALMKQRSIFVFTHDSIGLGEDGPTHQPVEQMASMRVTPNLNTWRPADAVETAVSWKQALLRKNGPTALVLSRQNLAHQPRTEQQIELIAKGGYVLADCEGLPELLLIATGSEVSLARQAFDKMTAEGRKVRLISMPCLDEFYAQEASYRESVIPKEVKARLVIEAAQPDIWYRLVGLDGDVVGMTTFGESAPAEALFKAFGFTLDNVYQKAMALLN
ncbi:MAG: transketolase [Gammaproteobacteria bacterium CG22_combo_CG10-13_8_21_14_all_40_8]|nr:MAG: transketolase [Gammaproteobacteria bacterium CG22_combo_CG10-13_8_21_14_all_40_8]